jgi:hypothetical protein
MEATPPITVARHKGAKSELRHRCRNKHCRSKLRQPVDNPHHAFCARGCFESFYRSRCLVCEEPMRRKRESQKLGSGHKVCEREYRKFPRVRSRFTTRASEVPILRGLNLASAPPRVS